MTARARLTMVGAALLGPLAAFPALRQPQLALALVGASAIVYLASRSIAYPLALWGVPGVVIGVLGSNPFPKTGVELFLAGWLALAIFLALLREDGISVRVLATPVVLATVVLLGLMLARYGSSPSQAYGGFKLQLFIAENLTFVVAGILLARKAAHLNRWVTVLIVTVSAGALVLLEGILSGSAKNAFPGRLALYAQAGPIALARGAASGLLLCVYLLLSSSRSRDRMLALVLLPVLAIAFLGAGSRGPVVGLVAALAILFALSFSDRVSRKRLVGVAVAGVVAAGLVSVVVPGQNLGRSLSILTGSGDGGGDTSNGRTQEWQLALRLFGQHPFTGTGTGGFEAYDHSAIYPHNIFLEGAAELGIGGLLAVVALIGFAFAYSIRAWRRAEGDERRQAALITSYLGAAVVNACFSGDFTANAAVWLAAGMAVGIYQRVAPSSDESGVARGRTRWRRQGGGEVMPLPASGSPLAPMPAPSRGSGGRSAGGGAITRPVDGAVLCGEATISALPAGTRWSVGVVTAEYSLDGRDWFEIGAAYPDDDYEVYVLTRGADGGRRQVAVVRSHSRAEEMQAALELEYGDELERVEIKQARKRSWTVREARQVSWDTATVGDGPVRLRIVTADVSGRITTSAEIAVTIDNTPPVVTLESPRPGSVLMAVADLSASAHDAGSGVASVRFETSVDGATWTEIGRATAASIRLPWNTADVGDGAYRLRAVAVDRAGNEAASSEVNVRVEQLLPPVKLVDPGAVLAHVVRLEADVRDATLGVEFQIAGAGTFDWHALGTATAAPFELEVDTSRLPDGFYDLRVVSRAKDGSHDASRAIRGRVIDNLPPLVTMFEPAADSIVHGEVSLSASAADAGSGVASVGFQFSADGETWWPVLPSAHEASSVSWDTTRIADGRYHLRAVAADAAGNPATSEPIGIAIDNTPPEVSLEVPAVPPETVRLTVVADDAGSGVVAVSIEISPDGARWSELATATAPPFVFVWNTAGGPHGRWLLRACARDRAGNVAIGEEVELTIANRTAPPPAPVPPAPVPPASVPPAEPVLGEPAPAPQPVPGAPAARGTPRVSLWDLEQILAERGGDHPRREELGALLYMLRAYARPDGTLPDRFTDLVSNEFGELVRLVSNEFGELLWS